MSASFGQTRRYAPARLFLIGLLFIAAAPVFWLEVEVRQGNVPAAYENADLYQRVYPLLHYAFTQLRSGELPLWSDQTQAGQPFLANPAAGLFQPLHALFLAFPTERAMVFHAFMSLALSGLFFSLFMRSLGAGYLPALTGAVVYAFGGAGAAAMSRPQLANVLVWTPLFFWGIREYAQRFRLSTALLAGVFGALLLLSGANALIIVMLALALPYRLVRGLWPSSHEPVPFQRRLAGLILMGITALALAAIQWLPALMWYLQLDNPWAAFWSITLPAQAPGSAEDLLGQLLVPKSGPLPRLAYLGAATLILLPAALCHRTARRDALYFALAGTGFFALSIGLHRPYFTFPFPDACFIYPATFAFAVLAGLGLDRLCAPRNSLGAQRIWLPALLVLASAAAFFYITSAEPRGRIIVGLLVLLPMLLLRITWISRLSLAAFAVLLFIDFTGSHANLYRHPVEDAPACYARYATILQAAEEEALGARTLVSASPLEYGLPQDLGLIAPHILCAADLTASTSRPASASLKRWQQGFHDAPQEAPQPSPEDAAGEDSAEASPTPPLNLRMLSAMGVRALIVALGGPIDLEQLDAQGTALKTILTEGNTRVLLNESALPRAFWTAAWRSAHGEQAAARLMSDPSFNLAAECIIDPASQGYAALDSLVPGPRDPAHEAIPGLAPGSVSCEILPVERPGAEGLLPRLLRPLSQSIAIRVEAPMPGVTILLDSYAQGWHATLDGEPCPILLTNGIFRGIATPAGTHEIIMEYRPWPFLAGLAITLASLAFLSLAALIGLLRM